MTTALSTDLVTIRAELLAAGVRALYTSAGREIEPAAFVVFERALSGEMSEEEFGEAVAIAIRTVKGFKEPSHLIAIVRELRRERMRSSERPPEDELRSLEAQADVEGERSIA